MKNFGAISDGKDLPIKKYADDRVIANPTLAGTEDDLTSIQIAGVKYKIPEGGAVGGNATPGDILYPKTAVVNGSLITGSIQVEQQTVTPTTSAQTVTPTSGNLLDEVTVNAIPNNYVDTSSGDAVAGDMRSGKKAWVDGVEITGNKTTRGFEDLTVSGPTVTVPAGIYDTASIAEVEAGTAKTPKTTYSVTPTLTVGDDGYVSSRVQLSEYITPTVVPGYVSEGTRGNVKVTGSAGLQLTTQAAQTIHPSTSDQSIAGETYLLGTQTIKGVLITNLSAGNIKKDVVVKVGDSTDDDCVTSVTGTYEAGSGGGGDAVEGDLRAGKTAEVGGVLITGTVTERDSTDLTASGDTVTVPAGIYDTAATKAVAAGSAKTPTTTITPNVGVQLITMIPGGGEDPFVYVRATASGNQGITPTVTPGYVSSGTSGLVTVSGSGGVALTTLNAATYHPSASDQTIAKDQYINGVQTIKGVTTTNLTAENIKAGVVVKIGDSTDDDCVTAVTGNYEPGPGGAGDAVAGDIRYQKTAVVGGEVVTGSVPERDSTDVTVSGKTVTVPAGIYDAAVSKSVADGHVHGDSMINNHMPVNISVSNSGLITASAGNTGSFPIIADTAGYVTNDSDHVVAGTYEISGSATRQLTTQAAQTITPTTTDQTIDSGTYLTGTQTIEGDANLVAGNIKKDVSIFGVTGTYEGGSSATEPYVEETYDSSENLTAAVLHGHTNIRNHMFRNCSYLAAVTIPSSVTKIGTLAFNECTSLVMSALPSGVTQIGNSAFYGCTAITLDLLPSRVTSVDSLAFRSCTGLTNMEIAATKVGSMAFAYCSSLSKVWFRSTCTTVTASSAAQSPFNSCPTNLKIYCEASSRPSGYSTYFNRTGSSGGTTVSVVYNRTTRPW